LSIIKHVTLQKIVAHDFQRDETTFKTLRVISPQRYEIFALREGIMMFTSGPVVGTLLLPGNFI
jgi:hypothetical protein